MPHSYAFALRQAKATNQTVWTPDWQRSPMKRLIPNSNRLPPSLNPTKHFIELKHQHKVFSCLVQCCTGHAYTGEFQGQFFPGVDVACICGENLQTHEHIIRSCTHYTNHQESLQDKNWEIALPELLGTPNGIAALSTFLQSSRVFTFTGEKFMPRNALSFEAEPEPPT